MLMRLIPEYGSAESSSARCVRASRLTRRRLSSAALIHSCEPVTAVTDSCLSVCLTTLMMSR